jgi:hypothetical protein
MSGICDAQFQSRNAKDECSRNDVSKQVASYILEFIQEQLRRVVVVNSTTSSSVKNDSILVSEGLWGKLLPGFEIMSSDDIAKSSKAASGAEAEFPSSSDARNTPDVAKAVAEGPARIVDEDVSRPRCDYEVGTLLMKLSYLQRLNDSATDILKSQPIVVELKGPVKVFGSVDGQLDDLLALLKRCVLCFRLQLIDSRDFLYLKWQLLTTT